MIVYSANYLGAVSLPLFADDRSLYRMPAQLADS